MMYYKYRAYEATCKVLNGAKWPSCAEQGPADLLQGGDWGIPIWEGGIEVGAVFRGEGEGVDEISRGWWYGGSGPLRECGLGGRFQGISGGCGGGVRRRKIFCDRTGLQAQGT